jgi:hypothetical protein
MSGAQKSRSIRTAHRPTSPCIPRQNHIRFAASDFARISGATAFNQNGIAELMRAKAIGVEHAIRAAQDALAGERVQQVVVARTGLVRAGQDCVDYTQLRVRSDALVRNAIARYDGAEARR